MLCQQDDDVKLQHWSDHKWVTLPSTKAGFLQLSLEALVQFVPTVETKTISVHANDFVQTCIQSETPFKEHTLNIAGCADFATLVVNLRRELDFKVRQ